MEEKNVHKFSRWEKFSRRKIVKEPNKLGELVAYNRRVDLWIRVCEECGYTEIVYKEPQELIERRENIKRLALEEQKIKNSSK